MPEGLRWSVEEATRALAEIAEPARQRGWLVAVYGSSIIHGRGRDLDLICVPWRGDADRADLAGLLGEVFGAVEVDRHESAWDQSLGAAYRCRDGRIIDVLYVRRVDDRDVV